MCAGLCHVKLVENFFHPFIKKKLWFNRYIMLPKVKKTSPTVKPQIKEPKVSNADDVDDLSGLSDAVGSVLRLRIHCRVPVAVEEYHCNTTKEEN